MQIFLTNATLFGGKEKSPDNLIQPEIFISPSPYRKLSKNYNQQLKTPAADGILPVRWFIWYGEISMRTRSVSIALLLTVPIVLVLVFDPASTLSLRNFLSDISGTIFLIDFPIGMCLLHYYYPQFFRHHKSGHYSLVPWGIFFLVCWGIVALEMFLETQFGRYPENGFSVVCAYLFGWTYIWFTMIPIGLIYLLFRCIQKLWNKRGER